MNCGNQCKYSVKETDAVEDIQLGQQQHQQQQQQQQWGDHVWQHAHLHQCAGQVSRGWEDLSLCPRHRPIWPRSRLEAGGGWGRGQTWLEVSDNQSEAFFYQLDQSEALFVSGMWTVWGARFLLEWSLCKIRWINQVKSNKTKFFLLRQYDQVSSMSTLQMLYECSIKRSKIARRLLEDCSKNALRLILDCSKIK